MATSSLQFGYFGHHKCASTWIQYLIDGVCGALGLRNGIYATPTQVGPGFAQVLNDQPVDFLCYTNADWSHAEPLLGQIKGFHVIRDPRDVAVSAYFSHRNSHISDGWPELTTIRAQLQKLNTTDGLKATIDNLQALPTDGSRIAVWNNLRQWHYDEHPNILELRYEDMVVAPYESFLEILEFLSLLDARPFGVGPQARWLIHQALQRISSSPAPGRGWGRASRLPLPVALELSHRFSFRKIAGGRKQGAENRGHHFRKGTPGDWRSHFNDELVEYFKSATGDLLEVLGYESDGNWGI